MRDASYPRRPWRAVGAGLAAAALVAWAACGDGAPAAPPPAVEVILEQSAAAMQAVQSLRFTMERTGAPVEIQGLEFGAAEGDYLAPDSARALLDVRVSGLTVQLGTISIGPRTWLTNPLTRAWDEFPEGTGFNPAIIFDAAEGWPRVLGEDMSGATVAASDDGTYTVRGRVAESRVEVLTAGLVSDQEVEVDLVVDAETALLNRVSFSTDGEAGRSDWVLEMSGFDEPVTIEPPADG